MPGLTRRYDMKAWRVEFRRFLVWIQASMTMTIGGFLKDSREMGPLEKRRAVAFYIRQAREFTKEMYPKLYRERTAR